MEIKREHVTRRQMLKVGTGLLGIVAVAALENQLTNSHNEVTPATASAIAPTSLESTPIPTNPPVPKIQASVIDNQSLTKLKLDPDFAKDRLSNVNAKAVLPTPMPTPLPVAVMSETEFSQLSIKDQLVESAKLVIFNAFNGEIPPHMDMLPMDFLTGKVKLSDVFPVAVKGIDIEYGLKGEAGYPDMRIQFAVVEAGYKAVSKGVEIPFSLLEAKAIRLEIPYQTKDRELLGLMAYTTVGLLVRRMNAIDILTSYDFRNGLSIVDPRGKQIPNNSQADRAAKIAFAYQKYRVMDDKLSDLYNVPDIDVVSYNGLLRTGSMITANLEYNGGDHKNQKTEWLFETYSTESDEQRLGLLIQRRPNNPNVVQNGIIDLTYDVWTSPTGVQLAYDNIMAFRP